MSCQLAWVGHPSEWPRFVLEFVQPGSLASWPLPRIKIFLPTRSARLAGSSIWAPWSGWVVSCVGACLILRAFLCFGCCVLLAMASAIVRVCARCLSWAETWESDDSDWYCGPCYEAMEAEGGVVTKVVLVHVCIGSISSHTRFGRARTCSV